MRKPNSQYERNLLAQIIIGAVFTVAFILVGMMSCARAQEHKHPPQDAGIHHQFYSTWMMPSNRSVSCCHDEDCFPSQSKMVDGAWYARKTDDEEWTKIPSERIERDRDSPDGRSHLCGRKYTYMGAGNGFTVFCFIVGAGG